ncbi:MAG: HEPN domain-containing protein [Aureibaculum sp.]|nr:HEPN domain-containing protein [Aureibaculum sp.]
MQIAKNNFISRLNYFEEIVSPENISDTLLMSRAFTETIHNEKVRMLRNGMAVIGFSILEDFIKNRMGEVLKEIGGCGVDFEHLPEKLRVASTVGALKGIQNRSELLKRNSEDYISFIQNEASCISNTHDSPFELSKYSIGWDKSNLSSNDMKDFLHTFKVAGGWDTIQSISSAININLTSPNEIFSNAAARRHKAAHSIDADSLLTDLQEHVSQSKVIAFAFDVLISKSLSHIKNTNSGFLHGAVKTEFRDLSFRFLLEETNKWKEYKGNSNRAYRVSDTKEGLLVDAKLRAHNSDEILVIKSRNNQIVDWENP